MLEDKYGGLTETQANEALCLWLDDRWLDGDSWNRCEAFYGTEGKVTAISAVLEDGVCEMPLFNESHDSIHRVLDAMTEEEKWDYGWALQDNGGTVCGETCPVLMAFMTPAQKTTAALMALGLAKDSQP